MLGQLAKVDQSERAKAGLKYHLVDHNLDGANFLHVAQVGQVQATTHAGMHEHNLALCTYPYTQQVNAGDAGLTARAFAIIASIFVLASPRPANFLLRQVVQSLLLFLSLHRAACVDLFGASTLRACSSDR